MPPPAAYDTTAQTQATQDAYASMMHDIHDEAAATQQSINALVTAHQQHAQEMEHAMALQSQQAQAPIAAAAVGPGAAASSSGPPLPPPPSAPPASSAAAPPTSIYNVPDGARPHIDPAQAMHGGI